NRVSDYLELRAFSLSKPANQCCQTLELHLCTGLLNPSNQSQIVMKRLLNPLVNLVNVLGIAHQGRPAKWSATFREHWPDVPLDETRKREGLLESSIKGLLPEIVPILERHRTCL